MQAQTVDTPAPTMRMASVPDGKGGFIHQLVAAPATPIAAKGRKKRHVPDPIKANPDAAAQQLRQFIERIESIDSEIIGMQEDRRDVFLEAKATGFDPKGMKAIITLRKMDPTSRTENEAIFETYKSALGME